MNEIIIEMTSTAIVAIAVFGIVFCLMQPAYLAVNRSFAMFLAAIAVNTFADAFVAVIETWPQNYVHIAELVIWAPSGLCLAPLFWIYVVTLTSRTQKWPSHLHGHFLLPGLAMLVGATIGFGSEEAATAIFSQMNPSVSDGALALLLIDGFLHLAAVPQIAVYLVLIVRRLMRHRIVLRDFYASTEKHELRWIYMIGYLGAIFWAVIVLIHFLVFGSVGDDDISDVQSFGGIVSLTLVATTTLWGLRQRPPLSPDVDDGTTSSTVEKPQTEKYEKSALSLAAAARIARKLRAAMEKDHLHRDPNLSLWVLARHVGASPNYISQTLNEEIGESFFDFVNGYRIVEAKALLAETDHTVLAIAYEVGFNARSSFYNAFKRVTGQTPTQYRKTLSHPVGMDDNKVSPRKT